MIWQDVYIGETWEGYVAEEIEAIEQMKMMMTLYDTGWGFINEKQNN